MNTHLAPFRHRHAGHTAWLFGKGPSLDGFLDGGLLEEISGRPENIQCAVNETVRDIPDVSYAFASDDCTKWRHLYFPGVILFRPRCAPAPAVEPDCTSVVFEQFSGGDAGAQLRRGPDAWIASGLAALPGTITSALQVLALMGIARIVCVGIDGGTARSRRPWLTMPLDPDCGSYDEIRTAFIRTAGIIGMPVHFWAEGEDAFGRKPVAVAVAA